MACLVKSLTNRLLKEVSPGGKMAAVHEEKTLWLFGQTISKPLAYLFIESLTPHISLEQASSSIKHVDATCGMLRA